MNEQKEPGRRDETAKKINRFLNGKGFYIVLFLCVAAIGISGYVIFFANNLEAPPEGLDIPDLNLEWTTTSTTAPRVSYSTPPRDTVPAQQTVPGIPEGTTTAPAAESSKQTEPPKKIFFVRPTAGELLRDFSGTLPVYNPTMADWRVHTGIDIAAELGSPVSSAAEGTVIDVYEDPFKGVCISVDHPGGVRSVYCGLAKDVSVKAGDSVKAGTEIGRVGATALFEALDEPHLHFEMYRDGEAVNPGELLPAP